jgi:hypothetical protein
MNGNDVGSLKSFRNINEEGYIVAKVYESEENDDGSRTIYEYLNGNLIKLGEYDDTGPEITNYKKYDDKKSPFSNTNTPKWILQELIEPYYACKNNVLEEYFHDDRDNTHTVEYKYEYDSDGFPTKRTAERTHRATYGDDPITYDTTITRYTYITKTKTVSAQTEPAAAKTETAAAKTENYAGIYEYEDRYDAYENEYIVLSEKDGKITGFYYGTSDEFDEAREGYDAGYFVAPMTNLEINGDAISFVLNVKDSDFMDDIIDLKITSAKEAIKAGNKKWINTPRFYKKEYAGHISASKGTIIIKASASVDGEAKFTRKETVNRVAKPQPEPPAPPTVTDLLIDAIVSIIRSNGESLNNLILKDFGVAEVNTPGIYTVVSMSDKMPYVAKLGSVPGYVEIGDWYQVNFEKFPDFNCAEEKWNKHGIYIDTTSFDGTLASIARMNNSQGISEWSAKELKKFDELGKSSRTAMIVDNEERALKFIITLWEGEWYITAIIEVDPCGA